MPPNIFYSNIYNTQWRFGSLQNSFGLWNNHYLVITVEITQICMCVSVCVYLRDDLNFKKVKGLEYQEDDGHLFHREKGSKTI